MLNIGLGVKFLKLKYQYSLAYVTDMRTPKTLSLDNVSCCLGYKNVLVIFKKNLCENMPHIMINLNY